MRRWQTFKLGMIVFAFFLNAIPIIAGAIRLSEGGELWGGKLPLSITLSFVAMIVCGSVGFIVYGCAFHELYVNRKYIGAKTTVRAILVAVTLYLAVGTMGSVATNNYSSQDGSTASCITSRIYELWDSDVYQQGKQAYLNFCHICKCHIPQSVQDNYSESELRSLNYNSFFGANNVAECDPREGQLTTSTFDLLKSMEANFKCAGFCNANTVFTFYGTSKGMPSTNGGCYAEVTMEIYRYKILIITIMMGIGGIDLMVYFFARSFRIDRIKEVMTEHGIDPNYERINSISMIGESQEDYRAIDPYSSMGQQRSNTSNNIKKEEGLDYKTAEHLRQVRRAFRSMHMANPLLKK